jgi:hypothetical protein
VHFDHTAKLLIKFCYFIPMDRFGGKHKISLEAFDEDICHLFGEIFVAVD